MVGQQLKLYDKLREMIREVSDDYGISTADRELIPRRLSYRTPSALPDVRGPAVLRAQAGVHHGVSRQDDGRYGEYECVVSNQFRK